MYKRETIHVSLGSTANAVTAHLLNLEGLAATSSNDLCDADVTHAIHNQCFVPRVLMADEPRNFEYQSLAPLPPKDNVPTWDGAVEVQAMEESSVERHGTASMHKAALQLANSVYSQYRVPTTSTAQSLVSSASNERHMKWDDNEEEEEEEDEEEMKYRQERERQRWYNETKAPLEQKLDDFWTQEQSLDLSWMDYWMPPFPLYRSYAAPLPLLQPCGNVETWDSFINGTTGGGDMRRYREDVLFDKLRRTLEASDGIQGFTIMTEGWGIYAGLATSLLQGMQEELRSAGRFVFHVAEPYKSQEQAQIDKENSATSWQPAHVERVRRNLQTGLALHGLTSNSHITLPLSLDNSRLSQQDSLFAKSATIAMVLETATLPYRTSGSDNKSSSIGLNGYFDGAGRSSWKDAYGTANSLSFGEYVSCLRPSAQHVMLEMDACLFNFKEKEPLSHVLQVGTSLERERLVKMGGRNAQMHRPRDVLPGAWMEDCTNGGILTPLSPQSDSTGRHLHRHLSMAASLRPHDTTTSVSHNLTSLMESMGIRDRPEVSIGSVVDQSVKSLTASGYGAGAYWKRLLKEDSQPVLSVIGSSTRAYPYLNSISKAMKDSLSHKYRGYHNRDVASDILPEAEDCAEALEYCLDLRDLYQPPEGSGLVVDSEGNYFDTNTD